MKPSKWAGAALVAAALWCATAVHAAANIALFDADGMARIVASQQGKPFVLLVWSLDCAYCEASMKTLVHEKTRRRFNVVTLATDNGGDAETVALIRKRLRSARLTENAWAFGGESPEQLRYAIDPQWRGEMPRSYWFDATGKRRAYSGVITPEVAAKMLAR